MRTLLSENVLKETTVSLLIIVYYNFQFVKYFVKKSRRPGLTPGGMVLVVWDQMLSITAIRCLKKCTIAMIHLYRKNESLLWTASY